MGTFTARESDVRSYCRAWPTVFDRAAGSWLYDTGGRAYLDFFAGAGALNYGHNNPALKEALLDYLAGDRVIHSLDMYTAAKRDFLAAFGELILQPRDLDYRVQFPGPGGANAVEAALKLGRRQDLGFLAITDVKPERPACQASLIDVRIRRQFLPPDTRDVFIGIGVISLWVIGLSVAYNVLALHGIMLNIWIVLFVTVTAVGTFGRYLERRARRYPRWQ